MLFEDLLYLFEIVIFEVEAWQSKVKSGTRITEKKKPGQVLHHVISLKKM